MSNVSDFPMKSEDITRICLQFAEKYFNASVPTGASVENEGDI